MLNFKIVENAPPDYLNVYDEFVELYNNPEIRVRIIRKKLGLNVQNYNKLRNKALKDGKIKNRIKPRSSTSDAKKNKKKSNYYQNINGRYAIKKYHKGEVRYYGIYASEEIAKQMVIELKKVDWDKKYLDEIREKVLGCAKN